MKRRDFLKGAAIGAGVLASGMLPGRAKAANDWGKRKRGVDFYRIDSYCHFAPVDYMDKLDELNAPAPRNNAQRAIFANNPSMVDVNARLNMMDDCEIDVSILVPSPFLEAYQNVYNDPTKAVLAAQFINDEIAGIVAQHPDRFKGVAILPTLNADLMLAELDRAVNQLKEVGGCFVVSPTAKPPDHADYLQLYEETVKLNVPLWMHPARPATYLDYPSDSYPPPPVSHPKDVQVLYVYALRMDT